MSAEAISINRSAAWNAILVAAGVTLLLALLRVVVLGPPMVFADEFGYAAWTSALHNGVTAPLEMAAALNNWLYLRLYGLTYVGTGSFLVTARVLNAVFVAVAAAALMPMFGNGVGGRLRVAGLALAIGYAVAVPGGYAAYYMPESPYIAIVCVLACALWRYGKSATWLGALLVGVAGGLATMMKSHGTLLMPGVLLAIAVHGWASGLGFKGAVSRVGIALVAWLSCTTVLAMVLGVDAGFNPLGKFYTDMAGTSASNAQATGIGLVFEVALWHFATLVTLAGLPLALVVALSWKLVRRSLAPDLGPLATVSAFLVPSLAGMILVTAVFTVGIAGTSVYEAIGRLHGRYYEYLAMMAACLGAFAATAVLRSWSSRVRLIAALLLVAAVALSLFLIKSVGWQSPNDFVSVYAMFATPKARIHVAALAMLSALVALRWPRYATGALSAALVLWFGYSTVGVDRLRQAIPHTPVDQVAAMVAEIEAGGDRSRVMVVASGADAYRAAFHLSEENTTIALPEGRVTCNSDAPPEWVITVAPAASPCAGVEVLRIDGVGISHVR